MEQAWLQARLAEWRHLEALGLVAGGLAHELNNQIMMIGHTVELAEMLDEPERYRAACQQVLGLCERIRKTVTQIQGFGRQATGSRGRFDLGELTAFTARLLRASVMPPVRVTERIEPGVYPVRANANQIQEVLIHVVRAGVAAMPVSGGVIEIRLERAHVVEANGGASVAVGAASWIWRVTASGTVTAPALWMALVECGAGVRRSQVGTECQEPRASAPEDDVGELAVRLKGLLDAHGAGVGWFGSGLAVEWPADVPKEGESVAVPPPSVNVEGLCVAVVEKEARELELLKEALQARGARVSAFGAAADFVRWLKGGEPPDLLVVNHVLDEHRGEALAELLWARAPTVPVLITGARVEGAEFGGVPGGGSGLPIRTLPKPFDFNAFFGALAALRVGEGLTKERKNDR